MKKLTKRIIAGAVIAACACGGAAYAFYPDSVDVETVAKADISQTITETGNIEADASVTVYAPVAGKVASVHVKANEQVKKGDSLAEYDLTSLEDDYEKALLNSEYYSDGYEAAVSENNKNTSKAASAAQKSNELLAQYVHVEEDRDDISISQNAKSNGIQATMQGIEGAIANYETNMSVEAAKLESASTLYGDLYAKYIEVSAEVTQSNTLISSYRTELAKYTEGSDEYNNYLNKIQEESETLVAKQSQLDKIKSEMKDASNAKDASQNSVNRIKDEITASRDALATLPVDSLTTEQFARYAELTRQLDLIERQWSNAVSEKTAAEEKIVNESQIKQYEDSAELAKVDARKALYNLNMGKEGIKAEYSGTVIERLADDGAVVEAGTPLFIIQPNSGYKAVVMISRYDIGSIKAGQKATVTMAQNVYDGTVSVISPIATPDSSGKPKVRVEIELDDTEIKPTIGLEAEVRIFTDEAKDALSVSDNAVYTEDEGSFVYVLNNGRIEKRNVMLGASGSGYTQIYEGLSEGEQVITSPVSDDDVGKKMTANK